MCYNRNYRFPVLLNGVFLQMRPSQFARIVHAKRLLINSLFYPLCVCPDNWGGSKKS